VGVRTICGIAIVCGVGDATAGVVTLDNGVTGTGHVSVSADDFGAYGQELSPQNNDAYAPAGAQGFSATQLAGAFLFVETPDGKRSATLLAADSTWLNLVEPNDNQADGLDDSEHTGLERIVTTMNAPIGSTGSHSVFVIGDPTANPPWQLTFDLTQTLIFNAAITELVQTYVITNTGQTPLTEVVFNAHWDANLIWDNGFPADIVGVGAGLCYVYTRDNGMAADQALSLADGGSSVPIANYYGGKEGLVPTNGLPAYTVKDDLIFTSFGTPLTWRNHIAQIGYDTVGESDTSEADPMMGLEWRFPLAMGAPQTIVLRRIYGTSTVPCLGGATCGDNVLDSGEDCDDGADTAECNLLTCTAPVCGDGYPNAAAGEECDPGGIGLSSTICNSDCTLAACGDGKLNTVAGEACDDGVETDTCNANCQPAMCGDGYVNAVASEQCEDGELCDPVTCSFDFQLGGGCAGCNTKRPDVSWVVALLALAFVGRRRRYNSRRLS
jgi:hypothetical protein